MKHKKTVKQVSKRSHWTKEMTQLILNLLYKHEDLRFRDKQTRDTPTHIYTLLSNKLKSALHISNHIRKLDQGNRKTLGHFLLVILFSKTQRIPSKEAN